MSGRASGVLLHGMELETCPFGELRHGAAAYEAVVAHGRADGGGEIPVAATCVHVDEALSQRLGQSARSLAFAWVSPAGTIPATHIWPLRPTQAFQQWARAGHTFALLGKTLRINCNTLHAIDASARWRGTQWFISAQTWSKWVKRVARTSPRVRFRPPPCSRRSRRLGRMGTRRCSYLYR